MKFKRFKRSTTTAEIGLFWCNDSHWYLLPSITVGGLFTKGFSASFSWLKFHMYYNNDELCIE